MNMFRPIPVLTMFALLIGVILAPGRLVAQTETIGSEHLLLRMPSDRSALGRDLAAELERCYLFMNRSTANNLPRKVIIIANWDQSDSSCSMESASVSIGMRQPGASADPRKFLLNEAAKEMARLGLLELSGGARREDTEFLFEGMTEILVHEYQHSSKALEGTWIISRFLDDMKSLGIATQRSWTAFSSGKRCFRNASPGVTLLSTYRELLGRDAPLKFFEALKKSSLTASLSTAFRASITDVENTWLKRVREYATADEVTVAAEEAPQLLQTALVPGNPKPGTTMEVQLYFKSSKGMLLPEGVFMKDQRTGRVMQPQTPSDKGTGYMVLKFPVAADCPPGDYKYQVIAIDESGNVRNWTGDYKISIQ